MEAHELTDEEQRHREMIEQACKGHGLTIDDWKHDEDYGGIVAQLGRWRVIADDVDAGLFSDDEGVLTASVVGAEKYHNERVAFMFTGDDFDSGMEVRSLETLEPAD